MRFVEMVGRLEVLGELEWGFFKGRSLSGLDATDEGAVGELGAG
jgi:hypothetical protein